MLICGGVYNSERSSVCLRQHSFSKHFTNMCPQRVKSQKIYTTNLETDKTGEETE